MAPLGTGLIWRASMQSFCNSEVKDLPIPIMPVKVKAAQISTEGAILQNGHLQLLSPEQLQSHVLS